MKIKIVGWFFIITAAVFLLAGIGLLLTKNVLGILGLCLGVYAFLLGSALKAHKKWSWYAGIITISLATLGNLFSLVMSFSPFLIVPLFLDMFILYVLIADRSTFLQLDNTMQSPPQFPQQSPNSSPQPVTSPTSIT